MFLACSAPKVFIGVGNIRYVLSRVAIDPCPYLNITGAATFAYVDLAFIFLLTLGNEPLPVIKFARPFHDFVAGVVAQFGIEAFGCTRQRGTTQTAPFCPEMPGHATEYGFAFRFAPAVPHVVEEAGDDVFICSFHVFSVLEPRYVHIAVTLVAIVNQTVESSYELLFVNCGFG